MLLKKKENVRVLSTARLAEGVYEMWLETDMAKERARKRYHSRQRILGCS